MQTVFVTGMGAISSLGVSVEQTYEALIEKRSGIGKCKQIQTVHTDIPVGEVSLSNDELRALLKVSAEKFSRTTLLGLVAAQEALDSAGVKKDKNLKTAVITGTTVSGLDRSEHFFHHFLLDNRAGDISNLLHHECGTTTQDIADYFGFHDYISTISTACSSSANAIALGSRLIAAGVVDRVLCGGEDALSNFTINGFNSMKILDRELCRPFDKTRSGLNIGEGAAFLVLESKKVAEEREKEPIARLSGWGNRCDAYHQTASSPEGRGPLQAMKEALTRAGITPQDIGYINVHGTGTPNNDITEARALITLFGEKVPPFSSTKLYTGHTLGAAGAIESVISLLSMQHNTLFPTFNFRQAIEEAQLKPITSVTKVENIKHLLTNSFGFGGNDTSLIFSKE
ncbi:beta-ketoacyl-[acyl-carrier-protein] synthase family protein [bacterium]|nr:beta-ketoacyl-[acyl-carrier-protein] synthase family protein [bacterium]